MKSSSWFFTVVLTAALLGGACQKKPAPVNQPEATAPSATEAPPPAPEANAAPAKEEKSEDKLAGKLRDPSPGKCLVYIVRPDILGLAVPFKVTIDGEKIGYTMGGNYLVAELDPGKHEVVSQSENRSSLLLTTEPDQVYFLEQEVSMGFAVARNHLSEIGPIEGKRALEKCYLSKSMGEEKNK